MLPYKLTTSNENMVAFNGMLLTVDKSLMICVELTGLIVSFEKNGLKISVR